MKALPDPPRVTQHDPIAIALAEDIGSGDLTSRYFVGTERRKARIFAKEEAVVAGADTAAEVLAIFHAQGFADAAVIGEVTAGTGVQIY